MEIERLQAAFSFAYDNQRADFYRAFYASKGFAPAKNFPRDAEEWGRLPFLTKNDIVSAPIERRTFVPTEDVLYHRTSSGTTNTGVLIVPRNFVPDRSELAKHTRRLLEFLPPHFSDANGARYGISVLGADIHDLDATARLASRYAIDGISAPVSILTAFIPHLRKYYDLAAVRLIFLWGERVSPMKREAVRANFPQALCMSDYSLSELHGAGAWSCAEMMRAGSLFVHPREELIFWELVDPLTGESTPEEGEVVLTTLWEQNAWPSLRYRTGDLARRVSFGCACGKPAYEILGRAEHDRAQAFGGLITSIELENALLPYQNFIEDDFELHLFEDSRGERAELRIRSKQGAQLDAGAIAAAVAASMRISPRRTLADIPGALSCVITSSPSGQPRKRLRIFIH